MYLGDYPGNMVSPIDPAASAALPRESLRSQLRRLEECLAEAWWYEEPLDRIMDLERAITRCRQELVGHGP